MGVRNDIAAHRRERVAQLRIRGMTLTEISETLERENYLNPATGRAWSAMTIFRDLELIKREWIERRQEAADIITATLLAELRAVRKAAWQAGDLHAVLASIRQERSMLGLDLPKKIELGVDMKDRVRQLAAHWGFDESQVTAELLGILDELKELPTLKKQLNA